MSFNPYSFENYTPTPTTPTSAFPWEQDTQAQTFGDTPQGPQDQHQPLPQLQHQLHHLQPRVIRGSLSVEPMSATSSSAEHRHPSAPAPLSAIEGAGMSFDAYSSLPSAPSGLPSPPVVVPSHSGVAYVGASSSAQPSRPASAMSTMSGVRRSGAVGAGAVQGMAGPVRVARTYGGAEGAHGVHPYRRPSTSGGARGGSVGPRMSPEGTAGRGRAREASVPPQLPSAESASVMSTSTSAMRSGPPLRIIQYQPQPDAPTVLAPLTVQCPAGVRPASSARRPMPSSASPTAASAPSPLRTHPVAGASATTGAVPEPASMGVSAVPPHLQALGVRMRTGRFHLRADVHYDPASRLWTAMLEVPGMKKHNVRVSLGACPYTRAKQLLVRGRMPPVYPEDTTGWTHRERKFGEFSRTLVVPAETRKEDVYAGIEDGVLTIKIPVGPPSAHEEEVEILLR